MDISQYLDIFIDESNEHLQNLNTQILNLESDPENMDTINEIFRAAHSLKGMAGTMGYKRMQTLTHDMENVFSEVRNGNIRVAAVITCCWAESNWISSHLRPSPLSALFSLGSAGALSFALSDPLSTAFNCRIRGSFSLVPSSADSLTLFTYSSNAL